MGMRAKFNKLFLSLIFHPLQFDALGCQVLHSLYPLCFHPTDFEKNAALLEMR